MPRDAIIFSPPEEPNTTGLDIDLAAVTEYWRREWQRRLYCLTYVICQSDRP